MSARSIAYVLGGHPSGDGYLVRCPVPGHGRGQGDRRPSLLIRDGEIRLLTHCFGGCDPRDVLAALQQRGLLDGPQGRPTAPVIRVAASVPSRSVSAPTARRLWQAAQPIAGTLAERYLVEHRGLLAPFPLSLRFAPDALHPRLRRHFPALLAAVQAPDRAVVAVQATWLSPVDGSKVLPQEPRWTFGSIGEGAVRLGPADATLGIAEGVEDALAASQLSQLSCWACLGAARMHRVRVPDSVSELHIFADDDMPGRDAAGRTALAHRMAGRRVILRLPPVGFKDWGDVVRHMDRRTAA